MPLPDRFPLLNRFLCLFADVLIVSALARGGASWSMVEWWWDFWEASYRGHASMPSPTTKTNAVA